MPVPAPAYRDGEAPAVEWTDSEWHRRDSGEARPLRLARISGQRGEAYVIERRYSGIDELIERARPVGGYAAPSHEDVAKLLDGREAEVDSGRRRWVLSGDQFAGDPGPVAEYLEALSTGRASDAALAQYQTMRDALGPDVERVLASAPSARRCRVLGIEGDEVQMDRYLRGEDKCLWARKRGKRRAKVTLAVNVGLSCGNTADAFARVAATAAAAAEVLERCGFAVEIDAVDALTCSTGASSGYARGDGDTLGVSGTVLRWPVKRTDERVDVERILSLAAPATSRLVGFGALCHDMPIGAENGLLGFATMPDYLLAAIGADALIGLSWIDGVDGHAQSDVSIGIQRIAERAAARGAHE